MKPKFKINNSYLSPEEIDYDIKGYHKERIIVNRDNYSDYPSHKRGELSVVNYWKNFDGFSYSNLIIKEERSYFRNEEDFVYKREMKIKWYLTDDSVGLSKNMPSKFYGFQTSYEEGKTRRSNVINEATEYLLLEIGKQNAIEYLSTVNNNISLFVNGNPYGLTNVITASTQTYMTQTIKDALLDILQ